MRLSGLPKREQALYVQMADQFRRRISSRQWGIGEQLPNVEELATQYGVARITVRQAMGILAREGLITRARGRGTHLVKMPPVIRLHRLKSDWDDFMQSDIPTESRVLVDRLATQLPPISTSEGRVLGRFQHLQMIGKRPENRSPMMIRDVFVRRGIYRKIASMVRHRGMMGLLGDHVSRVVIQNEIVTAAAPIAKALQVPVGTPILAGRRIGTDDKGAVIFLDLPMQRGDYVKLEIVLEKGRNRSHSKHAGGTPSRRSRAIRAPRSRNGRSAPRR